MTKAARFTQADVARALRAVKDGGECAPVMRKAPPPVRATGLDVFRKGRFSMQVRTMCIATRVSTRA